MPLTAASADLTDVVGKPLIDFDCILNLCRQIKIRAARKPSVGLRHCQEDRQHHETPRLCPFLRMAPMSREWGKARLPSTEEVVQARFRLSMCRAGPPSPLPCALKRLRNTSGSGHDQFSITGLSRISLRHCQPFDIW